jgi:hypothetical protein
MLVGAVVGLCLWLVGFPYERMRVSCVGARAGCWVCCWVRSVGCALAGWFAGGCVRFRRGTLVL